jgi:hypothetical protein
MTFFIESSLKGYALERHSPFLLFAIGFLWPLLKM